MTPFLRLVTLIVGAMLATSAGAQTVTITSPNTVNPNGQPKAVSDVFVRNADGTIASPGGSTPAAQGSTTSGQSGTLSMCAVVAGNQTYTVGQTQPLNCITNGRLKVGVSNAGNVDPAIMLTTTLTADLVACKNYATRVAWSDQFTGSVQCDTLGNLLTSNAASPSPGIGSTPVATTAAASSLIVKNAPGNLYGLNVTAGATGGAVMVFNATTVPADGAVQPAKCIPLAANVGIDLNYRATPIYFSVGIVAVFSSGATCFTKTASNTAYISADAK